MPSAVQRGGPRPVLWLCLLTLAPARASLVARVLAAPAVIDGVARLRIGGTDLEVAEGVADSIDSGARIWDAGLALSTLLGDQPSMAGKRVLELGSGTGIGGLTAAAAGAQVVNR